MEQGLIHVYCGEGKGKTTAAIGLSVRAAGTGKQVIFAQFFKGGSTGELNSFERLPNINVLRLKKDMGFFKNMKAEEKAEVKKMHTEILKEILKRINEHTVDMLVLDEITYPYSYDMIEKSMVENLLMNKPPSLELVLTGRNPAPIFLERADYITEMKKIRHPYDKNISARKGIEY